MQPPASIQEALHGDLLKVVVRHLGLIGLHEIPSVSRHFQSLAMEVLLPIYGIEHAGTTYLNYSTIMYELDALVNEALEGADMARASNEARAEAYAALKSTPEYMCMRIVLEAQFGACISDEDRKIVLPPGLTMLDLLNNAKQLSALPYLLDRDSDSKQWVFCMQGLVDIGRSDILDLLQFPKIDQAHFYQLLSITFIEPEVLRVAARALVRNEPEGELAKLVSFAVLGDAGAQIPSGPVPLFILQHMYKRKMAIPQDISFAGGLQPHSVSFWMHVMGEDQDYADKLLGIAMNRGDLETQCLACVFTGVSPFEFDLFSDANADVYQAMLVRFTQSRFENKCALMNFQKTFSTPMDIGYHTAYALLDCGLSELFRRFQFFWESSADLRALLGKMYRLGDQNLSFIVEKYLQLGRDVASSLKLAIQNHDDDQHIQSLWESIQAKPGIRTIAEHCCMLPLSSIRRLTLERSISVNDVQDLLSEVKAYQAAEMWLSKEDVIRYTLMFFVVRDEVVDALLGSA